jgi:hypothetical protein
VLFEPAGEFLPVMRPEKPVGGVDNLLLEITHCSNLPASIMKKPVPADVRLRW